MLELLTNVLETLKKIYEQGKKDLVTGKTQEAKRKTKIKEIKDSFSYSNIEGFKKSYENGDITYAINELKEEYKLGDDRVRYYKDIFYAAYETLRAFVALNAEQVEALDVFRGVLTKLEAELLLVIQDKRKELNNEKELIEQLMHLIESIEKGKDKIDLDDFNVISEVLSKPQFYYELKRKIYASIRKTNDSKKKRTPVSFNDLTYLLKKLGYSKEIENFSAEEQLEIFRVSDVQKIRDILSFMTNNDILNRFSIRNLIVILLYGNEDYIKKIYSEVKTEANLGKNFYYNPSIWIKRSGYTEDLEFMVLNNNDSSYPLYSLTKGPSYEETKENVSFLLRNGCNLSNENETILGIGNKMLTHNYNYARTLGLRTKKMFYQFKDKNFDSLIDGYLEAEEMSTIVDDFPLALYELKEKFLLALWVLKHQDKDGYRNTAFKLKDGKKVVNEEFITLLNKKSVQELTEEAQTFGMFVPSVPTEEIYKSIIEDIGLMDIEEEFYGYNGIKILDSNNMVDPVNYVFGSNVSGAQVISRPKVVRIFGALMKSGIVEDEKEALLYALIYNTIMDKETYELIKRSIGYVDKKSLTY